MAEPDPLSLLGETVNATADEDHPQRHDLAGVREEANLLLGLAAGATAAGSTVPSDLRVAARVLDDLIRTTPSDQASIDEALTQFRLNLVIFLVLAGAGDPTAALDLREAAELAITARTDAEAAATEISRLLEASQRIVGQAADDKLAGHYRERADDESTSADRWRTWTITGLGGTVVLGAVTAAIGTFGDRNLEQVLGGGGLSLAVGALTAYLGSQSKIHRDRETTFRQAELKLAVVSPMLDAVSAEARDDLQVEVVKLLFQTERWPGQIS